MTTATTFTATQQICQYARDRAAEGNEGQKLQNDIANYIVGKSNQFAKELAEWAASEIVKDRRIKARNTALSLAPRPVSVSAPSPNASTKARLEARAKSNITKLLSSPLWGNSVLTLAKATAADLEAAFTAMRTEATGLNARADFYAHVAAKLNGKTVEAVWSEDSLANLWEGIREDVKAAA